MKKQKQYKIDYVRDREILKEIALSQNVIIEALEIYLNKEFKDGEHIGELIKVILKKGEELETLKEGITYNYIDYLPLLTSPNMQKAEENENEGYKLEYIFIKKEFEGFKDKLEDILSLGKSKEWENKDEFAIVKDVTARLGLATSGTYKINHNFSFIVLPEESYTYLTNNYIAFKNKDYSETVDITPDSDPKAYEHTIFDGFGLMSNNMANIIQKQLKKDHRVDFAIIRGYNGLAIKGLCLRFDWNKYFKENYIEDTDFIKKSKNGFDIKDYKGNWKDTNVDFILTESQVKWLKNWTNLDEWQNSKDNFDDKYKTIINNLYITKTNKNPKKLKTHTLANYQLLNNIAITPQEIEELSNPTETYYKKILDYDIDSIRLFMGDMANDITIKKDEEMISEGLNASTKVQFLLQTLGTKALKMKNIREIIQNMITKKISQAAGGKFYIEGGYKLAACCPISFCNWIMTRDTCDNGLQEREYYIPKWNKEKVVMSRNPIACFQEIQRTEIVDKENINKWLEDYTSELIFYNQKDDTAMKMSGMDFDGDGNLITKNKLIYNSVVIPDKVFVNLSDGKEDSPKHKYTKEQRWENEVASSGNLIGKIANCTSIINSYSQSSYYYKKEDKENGKLVEYSWKDLLVEDGIRRFGKETWEYLNSNKEDEYADARDNTLDEHRILYNKKLKKLLENGEIEFQKDWDKEKQRKLIKERFFDMSVDSYCAVELSMMAIDAPKTLKFPTKELKYLKEYNKMKKPSFMCYLGKCKKKRTSNYRTSLDINGKRIAGTLLKKNLTLKNGKDNYKSELDKKCNTSTKKNILHEELKNHSKKSGMLNKELQSLYSEFSGKYLKSKTPNHSNIEWIRAKFNLDEDEYTNKEAFSISNLYFINEYREITKNLELNDIVYNLLSAEVSVTFMLDIAWNTIETCIRKNYKDLAKNYIEDKNGDIDWLFKKYRKIKSNIEDNKLINKDIIGYEKRLGNKTIKLSFKRLGEDIVVNEGDILTVNGEYLINKNNEKLELYKDKKGLIEDYKKIEILDYKVNKKSIQIEVKIIEK
ncbi:hypothetical protein ACFO6R_06440 [Eubacterium multiforme]|uniref:RNA dependent RNA polymerase n=1 Tax=Eubacterium multiforme TaxID=83339 RepID=A0ABT9USD6_9FIRM|nr:hypothetical protein [Eubacterium multiforme]MDQ0149232.1 hypothetical protein [Eubacterium multiforme]